MGEELGSMTSHIGQGEQPNEGKANSVSKPPCPGKVGHNGCGVGTLVRPYD